MSKHPSEMTDAEFSEAIRNREWRQIGQNGQTVAPKPATHPSKMTDAEFNIAMRNKAWRNPPNGKD
jgi:hypothetical protein